MEGHMRGINLRSLISNWDAVVHKLCEEVTTYDVLTICLEHVKLVQQEFEKNKINSTKQKKAIEHLKKALELLNPEI